MSNITTVTEALESLTRYTVKEVNRYIKEDYRTYSGKTLQHQKNQLNTADFTKLFQYIVNDVIETGIKELGLENSRREEVAGYDYIILGTPVEFKLMGGESKSSFKQVIRHHTLVVQRLTLYGQLNIHSMTIRLITLAWLLLILTYVILMYGSQAMDVRIVSAH